ncbi:polysaccharide biosynthesis tyrosine autokinase [Microbacterium mangrovi]|uniref:polysaccharide biosynthesis tyrosine autokinase n=1 Tax=Microbacterium mangrovi TaxID=1348253 RepID=UPI00068F3FA7|nr:polysaccharide biosynthesis tyrosine autokinase [Microbacterium mangrovi]
MTVLDFVRMTRRGWRVLLIAVASGLLLATGYVIVTPKTYTATSNGFISADSATVIAGSDKALQLAGSYLPLITSGQVREKIAAIEGVAPDDLSGALSAGLVRGSTMIQVTASSDDPASAARLANGALTALADVISNIEKSAGAGSAALKVVPLDNATVPTSPSSPNWKLIVPVGALGGLVVGYLFLLLRGALDVRVRAATDMNELLGTGVLGRVPRLDARRTGHKADIEALAEESYRQIRTGLRFASVDAQMRTIAVTSANQSEGKSTTAVRLAQVLAESGERVLLIDADLRRPTMARKFGIDGTVGLSEVLSGQLPLRDAVVATQHENLLVLPSGGIPPNPSEMLGSQALGQLLAEVRRECLVIVDTPPVLPVTDALLVGALVDGVVFVAAVGQTRKAEVVAARTFLEPAKAHLLGVVMNKVPLGDSDSGYQYYRYSYYSREAEKGRRAKRIRRDAAPGPRRGAQPEAAVGSGRRGRRGQTTAAAEA